MLGRPPAACAAAGAPGRGACEERPTTATTASTRPPRGSLWLMRDSSDPNRMKVGGLPGFDATASADVGTPLPPRPESRHGSEVAGATLGVLTRPDRRS